MFSIREHIYESLHVKITMRKIKPTQNHESLNLGIIQNYFTYILTNKNKTVLYTGVTNNLKRRLFEHQEDAKGVKGTFAGKYNCYYLVYYERFQLIEHAIKREKEIKGWNRSKN